MKCGKLNCAIYYGGPLVQLLNRVLLKEVSGLSDNLHPSEDTHFGGGTINPPFVGELFLERSERIFFARELFLPKELYQALKTRSFVCVCRAVRTHVQREGGFKNFGAGGCFAKKTSQFSKNRDFLITLPIGESLIFGGGWWSRKSGLIALVCVCSPKSHAMSSTKRCMNRSAGRPLAR